MTQHPAPTGSLWAARAEGMQAAADHAERDRAGWMACASEYLATYAKRSAHPFTSEECIASSKGAVPEPPDARAWGAVFGSASRRKVIRKVGYATRIRNASPGVLWKGFGT